MSELIEGANCGAGDGGIPPLDLIGGGGGKGGGGGAN